MKIAWSNLTISTETSKEIGTMFVKSKIQVPKARSQYLMYMYHCQYSFGVSYSCAGVSESKYPSVSNRFMRFHTKTKVAATQHKAHWVAKMTTIDFVIKISNSDLFCFDRTELRIIRVSWPVWTTTPTIQSVFLKLDPLKRKFSWESEIRGDSSFSSMTP